MYFSALLRLSPHHCVCLSVAAFIFVSMRLSPHHCVCVRVAASIPASLCLSLHSGVQFNWGSVGKLIMIS